MASLNRKIIIAILVFFTFYGCSRKEDIVANIGSRQITTSDFEKRIKNLPEYYLGFIATDGGKRQYLTGIIKEEILLLKGQEMKIGKKSDVMQRIQDMKREILLTAIIDYIYREEIRISDQEIKDHYEDHKDNYANPEQIKVSHILLSDEVSAKKILKRLNSGVSFEKLARENSIDTVTAINGGDLGYFGRGEMLQPEFEKEVFKLKKVGQISSIIKTPFGYHIAKLTGRRKGKEKTFEESREEIKTYLEKQKFNEIIDNYKKEHNVRVNYEVLDEIKIVEEEVDENE